MTSVADYDVMAHTFGKVLRLCRALKTGSLTAHRSCSFQVNSNVVAPGNLLVDTHNLVLTLEKGGFTREQSECMTSVIVAVLSKNAEMQKTTYVTSANQELTVKDILSSIQSVKKDMLILEKTEFTLLRNESEKLVLEVKQLRKQLEDEILKLKNHMTLDINLEKSRNNEKSPFVLRKCLTWIHILKYECTHLELDVWVCKMEENKVAEVEQQIELNSQMIKTEAANLLARLEATKTDTLKYFAVASDVQRPLIDYQKLKWLCSHPGLQQKLSGSSTEEAHQFFMEHYHQMFVDDSPKASIPLRERDLAPPRPILGDDLQDSTLSYSECGKTHVPPEEQSQNLIHDIKHHMAKLHKERKIMDPDILFKNKIKELRGLIRKPPYERSAEDNKRLFKHLKTFPDISKQVSDKELNELCTAVQLDIWRDEEYTVFSNSGFHLILKGSVKPETNPWIRYRNTEGAPPIPSIRTFSPQLEEEDDYRSIELSVGDCFGTLERVEGPEPNSKVLCVKTKAVPCEFLKICSNDFKRITDHIREHEVSQKTELIQACKAYKLWPRQSLQKLAELLEWTKFPENTVLVSEGFLCPFIGFIKMGECHVLRQVDVNITLPNGKEQRKKKQVVIGQMKKEESFGEISVLESEPITCSIVTASPIDLGIIRLERINELDETTRSLLFQSNERLFGDLTQDQIHDEYIDQERKRQWNQFKHGIVVEVINAKGVRPGYGKWAK